MNNELPLKPVGDDLPSEAPRPAPAWVPFASAWLGLLALIFSIVLLLLPGSRSPRAELERARPWALADKFLPVPVYTTVVSIFLAIVVFWQMRKEPRPLPQAMLAQRTQAWAGVILSLIAIVIFYAFAAHRAGPVR